MTDTSPRGRTGIAWAVILLTATVVIAMHALPDDSADGGDSMDLILLQMQSQYIVGTRQLIGSDDRILAQTAALNTGSVTQRQSYVALTGELAGPEAAATALAELSDLIRQEQASSPGFELTAEESRVQEALGKLFPARDEDDTADATAEHLERVEALPTEDREALSQRLGWIGRVALAPEGADDDARKPLLAQAWRVTLVVIGVFGTLMVLGLLGAAGLVALAVMAAGGKVRSGLGASTTHHGIYAETFAIWMVSFVLLQLVAGLLAALVPRVSLGITAGGFLASLGALLWPRFRGIAWEQVRADVGLTGGERGFLEPLFGVGGYVLALPMLAVGILCTLLLMTIEAAFSGGGSATFASTAPPAHPIVGEIAHAGWAVRVQVLLLAAVVAPIVEETMFRGVLYRHLRDATAGLGLPLSVLASAAFNGLLFAAIHPQGWVAIPALMSLAFAFVLLREWRGTLVPSMIVHGISNGLVMLMLMAIVGS